MGEFIFVAGLSGFAMSAYRNLPTAILALAPVAVTILARSWDDVGYGEAASSALRITGIGSGILVGAALVFSLATAAGSSSPFDPDRVPLVLLDRIPPGARVLPTYNVAGAVLWRAGPPPAVQVAIDGRTDRYGADYLRDYAALEAGAPGWETLLDELAPTEALLRSDRALAELLVARRGWTEVARTADHVLLRAPR